MKWFFFVLKCVKMGILMLFCYFCAVFMYFCYNIGYLCVIYSKKVVFMQISCILCNILSKLGKMGIFMQYLVVFNGFWIKSSILCDI